MSANLYPQTLRFSERLNKGSECRQTAALYVHFTDWRLAFLGIWRSIEL